MNKKLTIVITAFLLVLVTQVVTFAQDGKSISDLARKAVWGSPVSATGNGIKGTFTPARVSPDPIKDMTAGFLIGLLDLAVTNNEYDKVRSGKFDLFLKKEETGLRLYFEEKGKVTALLEAFGSAPEDSVDDGSGALAFPYPGDEKRSSILLSSAVNRRSFGFAAQAPLKAKKIYIIIVVNGHKYYVWSGATKKSK